MDMKNALRNGVLEALRFTRAGNLTHATAVLQRVLGGRRAHDGGEPSDRSPSAEGLFGQRDLTIEGNAAEMETAGAPAEVAPASPYPAAKAPFLPQPSERPPVSPGLRGLFDRIGRGDFQLPGDLADPEPEVEPTDGAESGQFLTASFSNMAGSRPYKLYVPGSYRRGTPAPLVVMLHGCTQTPDDFAAGTRMNEAAERHGCFVAYPGQIVSANRQKCWNWFSACDQVRDRGEPSLIAGITRKIMGDYEIDPRRVYVCGLSAGGAAAAVLGDAYPDLYTAIGVHSGLACGAARDVASALAAMKTGARFEHHAADALRSGSHGPVIPTIIFHGDRDTTVNPRNADAVAAQVIGAAVLRPRAVEGKAPGGHAYRRTLHLDSCGRTMVEQWVVRGGGHAWSGGSANGSFTDPRGPDATTEMLRFFLEHSKED